MNKNTYKKKIKSLNQGPLQKGWFQSSMNLLFFNYNKLFEVRELVICHRFASPITNQLKHC